MIEDLITFLNQTIVANQWNKVGIFHHHGICLPLSALHSKNSCGIGEFFDLLPIIDWCHELNLTVLQLLPLTDSGDDQSPYYAISSCALNPLFLSLMQLPLLDQYPDLKKKIVELQTLTKTPTVQFADVQSRKFFFLQEYYTYEGKNLSTTQEFADYLLLNPWVKPYALFKAIKKIVSKNHWMSWPKELQKPTGKEFDALIEKYADDVQFHCVLQYLCYLQMKEVQQYASKKKVHLFGDLPILLSADSADVWHHQKLFDLTLQAGAPPDYYNKEGQAWGFPIMNWEEVEKQNFNLWKERITYASHFYNIYRIDHVLGIFRMWAIPLEHPSKDGAFIPPDRDVWIPRGKHILKMLAQFDHMLPIAEDLGTLFPKMKETLRECGICGTKVMRWQRNWETDKSFIPPQEYEPISLTTVSTHDSETLELWWRDTPEESRAFATFKHWQYQPKLTFEQRKEILWDSHHSGSLFHVNLLQEYLALFPELVSEMPEKERINVPGTVSPSNWSYRFRPSVEEIVAHEPLKKEIIKCTVTP